MRIGIALFAALLSVTAPALAADQGQDCNPRHKYSADCSGSLICRSVGNERGVWKDACVGRGLSGDLCAYDDRGKGSQTCGGSRLCRLLSGQPYTRCYEPGSQHQNDACDPIDAGKGSSLCSGELVCKDTGGGFYTCVGRGRMGDYCAASGAGKGSQDCGGDLVCRAPPYGAGPYTCQP